MIVTKHPGRKKGIVISQNLYEELADFIVRTVSDDLNINLLSLMKSAEATFPRRPDINLLVYHIKLDLEAKGMIKTVANEEQANLNRIRLTSQGIKERRRGEYLS